MRKIKFRFWHIEEKFMINWEYAVARCSMEFLFTYGALDRMQYVGLKDKNGKDIYEGDIIQFIDSTVINGSNKHQSVVKWVHELSGFYINAACFGYYQVNLSQCEMYHYEIIGNIYENPELLIV